MLDEINQRLKAAKLGIRVVQRGDRLSLRATLPPRPDSGKTKAYQQYLSLGIYANPAGFKRAEAEAYQVASLLAVGKFDWSEYLLAETAESKVVPIAKWIERLEEQYFSQRARTKKTQNTWDAVRTLYFGWDISLAAAQMGHSVAVHCSVYHRWITDRHHQRAFEILMNRSDRPVAP